MYIEVIKKTLLPLLPSAVREFLIRMKYKKALSLIHKENIVQSKVIKLSINDNQTKSNLHSILLRMCIGASKEYGVYFSPIAIIEAKNGYDNYLKILNSNARSKIKRAAKKGVTCKPFRWNNYLDDIYAINNSSKKRQGREMDEAYLKMPKSITENIIGDLQIRHIGAFHNNILVGYIELYIYNNFCMTNRLLGHKNFQKIYIMNALFAYSVQYAIENKIDYINYLTMINKTTNSLSSFKNRLGFREYSLKIIE